MRRHEAPEDVPERRALPAGDPVHLPALLVERLGVALDLGGAAPDRAGRREAERRRRVAVLDLPRAALAGALLQVGKRRFARLTA